MSLGDHLKRSGVLRSETIVGAFESVNRADFVRPADKPFANRDHPMSIGHGQTISQPYTVAFMLELLSPQPGQKILDVGSGSGWTTAMLANITGEAGRVIGVERVPELVKFGSKNLAKYQFKNARIERALDSFGWPDEAPYDRILVSAEAVDIPEELIEQLKDGGTMVIPIGYSICKVIKSGKKLDVSKYPGFIFVPLVQ